MRHIKSQRQQIEEAQRGNEFVRQMFSPESPPMDYSDLLRPKRAAPVRDPSIPSEHQLQSVVISWWRLACGAYKLPEFALFAVPNGGARDAITGARLKAEGVRSGIPDLMLATKRSEFSGLFIEMKRQRPANAPSPAQKEVIAYLQAAGYCCRVCFGADDAIEALRTYLRREIAA